jgi:solute carrier family 25 S-adenosylmethionine transporter 26
MQSRAGFFGSGGFTQLFRGVGSAALGSAPSAALFFSTYEGSKKLLTSQTRQQEENVWIHCFSAGMAEVMACIVRVPTENVKQKVQAGMFPSSSKAFQALWNNKLHMQTTTTTTPTTATTSSSTTTVHQVANSSSRFHLFYRGFFATIMREIPFAFIQLPLYEKGKIFGAQIKHNYLHQNTSSSSSSSSSSSPLPLSSFECACVGSVSGGIAAACTTPLDVVKTRLMLSSSHIISSSLATATSTSTSTSAAHTLTTPSIPSILSALYKEGGMAVLFSGVVPRVTWISMGGFVFFGAYEKASKHLTPFFNK